MTGDARDLEEQLRALRASFDRAFAEPARGAPPELETLLAVGVGPARFAVRVREIASLESRRAIVPLPGGLPGLLGLAGVRGRLIPVYGLAELLGREGGGEGGRWLLVCGRESPVGLAFAELHGCFEVPRGEVVPGAGGQAHVSGVVGLPAGACGVLSVPSLVAEVGKRAAAAGVVREG